MTDDNPNPLRSRQQAQKMAGSNSNPSPWPTTTPSSTSILTIRTSPYLPTPLETLALAIYPTLLVFGTLFSVLSPQTRGAPYDALAQSHFPPSEAPSYFARKDNIFNVLFVKRGWAWVTLSFAVFVFTCPAFAFARNNNRSGNGSSNVSGGDPTTLQKIRAFTRYALVTIWWTFVTQWFFGAPLIDRGFRFTGGKCEVAVEAVEEGVADQADAFTAAACRAAGGRWSGGHDISGHVFLLVLGSFFLLQEVGWVAARRAGALFDNAREERCVVMSDGAVKGAGVEAEGGDGKEGELGFGGRFALGVVGLCWWMLLMTAIYFHTWFEKLTGLLVAAMAIYPVYILPRWIPGLRAIIGLPGI